MEREYNDLNAGGLPKQEDSKQQNWDDAPYLIDEDNIGLGERISFYVGARIFGTYQSCVKVLDCIRHPVKTIDSFFGGLPPGFGEEFEE